jgi:HK97 family phage prohead protease
MPYQNEHAARLENPDKFSKDSFRRTDGGKLYNRIDVPKTISIIWGKLRDKDSADDPVIPQALRFPVKNWSVSEAKAWLKDNKINADRFEQAEPKKAHENKGDKMLYKSFRFELGTLDKAMTETEDGLLISKFTGAMATSDKDRSNHIIEAGAFDKSLKRYRKENRSISLYYNHQTYDKLPIGIIDPKTIKYIDGKWMIEGQINRKTDDGNNIYWLMKQGALSDLSIGASVIDYEDDEDKNILYLKQLELWEVSIVGEPANPKAMVDIVKSMISETQNKTIEASEAESEEVSREETEIAACSKNDVDKINLTVVKSLSTKKAFNTLLVDTKLFSLRACEYLASCFNPKSLNDLETNLILTKLNILIDKLSIVRDRET